MQVVLHDLAVVPSVLARGASPGMLASDDEDALVRLTDALGGAAGPSAVVVPTWSAEGCRQVATARAALDRHSVLTITTDLPPAAAGVLGSAVAAVAGHLPEPGLLPAVMDRVAERITAFALLGSVTGLEHLQPSLGQHVASWSPGSRFLAVASPVGRVERVGRRTGPQLPPARSGHASLVFGHGDDLQRELLAAVRDRRATQFVGTNPPAPGGARWWGTAELAEGVDFPTDMAEVATSILAELPSPLSCAWCARRVPAGACPFCHNRNDAT